MSRTFRVISTIMSRGSQNDSSGGGKGLESRVAVKKYRASRKLLWEKNHRQLREEACEFRGGPQPPRGPKRWVETLLILGQHSLPSPMGAVTQTSSHISEAHPYSPPPHSLQMTLLPFQRAVQGNWRICCPQTHLHAHA